MSSKQKPAAKPALTPKLRFPEFRDQEGWKETQLQKIAQPVSDRAVTGDGDNILSLSGEHGLVLQSDYFGKKIAGDSAERYLKLLHNDFVYNDRTTKTSTFGTIKRLSKYEGGIVSPIYKCFRFHADENPVFWEWYFESGSHDVALGGLVNEGARAGRFNISISQFLSTSARHPDEPEQQKIAECLSSVDELIGAQARKVDALKGHKKGLMQQLFPREGETQPSRRFPEFRNAGEWELRIVSQLAKVTTGAKDTQNKVENGRYPFFVRSQTVERIDSFSYDGEAVLTSGDGVGVGKNFHYIKGKFDFHQRVYCIYDFTKDVSGMFFYLYFSEHFGERVMRMSAKNSVDSVRMAMITEMPIVLPSLPEQRRIASCLTSLDELIAAQTQKLAALKTHKNGLMQQLFPSLEEAGA